jgi:hypothetical protein
MESAIRAAEPKTPANEATAVAIHGLAADVQEMVRVAAQHLSTSSTDSTFTDLDQRFKDSLEQLPKSTDRIVEASRTANVSSGDLSSAISTLRSSLAEILRLSTLDTNNQSANISLTTARDSVPSRQSRRSMNLWRLSRRGPIRTLPTAEPRTIRV